MATSKKAAKTENVKKKSAAAGPEETGGPRIVDTSLAAEAAARMVAARGSGKLGTATGAAKPETSMFRQLKENVAKPHLAGVDTLLSNTTPPGARPANLPTPGDKPAGHHQTLSTEASRRNIPRRTAG